MFRHEALLLQAVSISETSINFCQNRGRNISENSHLPIEPFVTIMQFRTIRFSLLPFGLTIKTIFVTCVDDVHKDGKN
jgi:hypothetical protein